MELPQHDIDHILATYRECGSLRETARRTNRDPKTVTRYVRAAGLPIGPAHGRGGRADGRTVYGQKHVGAEELAHMLELAHDGHSCRSIARLLGRSQGAVQRRLRRAGFQFMDPATRARRYPLDEHAFDELTPQALYWLGMLAADGNVYGNQITLVQKASEAAHARRFLDFVGTPRPLYIRPATGSVAAVISSRHISDTLTAYGITERKSYTLELDAAVAAGPACWLGMLDGDGSAFINSYDGSRRLLWTGTCAVMEQCADFWEPILGRRYAVYRQCGESLWGFVLSGRTAGRAAGELLASVPYSMPRKRRMLREIASSATASGRATAA